MTGVFSQAKGSGAVAARRVFSFLLLVLLLTMGSFALPGTAMAQRKGGKSQPPPAAQPATPDPPAEPAQEPMRTAPTLQMETKLVSMDVVVTDNKGMVVPGLTKDDFTIYEDDKVQIIRNFDSFEERKEIPETAPLDHYGRPQWGDAPLAILVLDQIGTDFGDSAYAAGMLKRYLKSEPALLPVPTMLMMVADDGYKTLQVYTRDRDALINAVDKRPPVLPSRLMRHDYTVIMVQTFLVLGQIALAESGLKEHKSIIWVGPGFASIDMTELDDKDAASLKKAIRETVDMLVDTHTAVYKIDPVATTTSTQPEVDLEATLDAGGMDALAPGEDPLETNFNFNAFAVETGGTYFYGQNDLDRYFRRAVEQTDQFYTLTYKPPLTDLDGEDIYRKIRVEVDKPYLHVTTRKGFYSGVPPEPAPTSKELGMSLSSVAAGDMSFTGVGVNVLGVAAGKEPRTAAVTFEVEDRSLAWVEDKGIFRADAAAVLVAFDAKHNILNQAAYQLKPYLTQADAPMRLTAALTVRDDVALDPKTAMIRLIVHDSSGRIGTADIQADTFKNLLISLPPTTKRGRRSQ